MPSAWALDLTRLNTRLGRVLTGIDRVELAWARFLLDRDAPVFAIVRTRMGFLLLDRKGVETLCKAGVDHTASPEDAMAVLRANALARVTRLGLWRLTRHLPRGTVYLNFGHSNLNRRMMRAIRSVPGSHAYVLLHDAIPLDMPEVQRPGSTRKFTRKLRAARGADGFIFPSAAARDQVVAHLKPQPSQPLIVAPLGPGLPQADTQTAMPPRFVMVGTIEPRKNHDLIFDVWQDMIANPPPGGVPGLDIIGSPGWAEPETFTRLEALTATGHVRNLGPLGDAETASTLAASHGLLFPSLAEGYGLPALEALLQRIPVLCHPMPVFREVLGELPVYVPKRDIYHWRETITEMMGQERQQAERAKITAAVGEESLPTWDQHFNTVLTAIE